MQQNEALRNFRTVNNLIKRGKFRGILYEYINFYFKYIYSHLTSEHVNISKKDLYIHFLIILISTNIVVFIISTSLLTPYQINLNCTTPFLCFQPTEHDPLSLDMFLNVYKTRIFFYHREIIIAIDLSLPLLIILFLFHFI